MFPQVWVVDDVPDTCVSLKIFLETYFFCTVICFTHGLEAKEEVDQRVSARCPLPAAIICDGELRLDCPPFNRGEALIAHVREHGGLRQPMIIAFSDNNEPLLAAGANCASSKNPDELVRFLNAIIGLR